MSYQTFPSYLKPKLISDYENNYFLAVNNVLMIFENNNDIFDAI